MEHATFEPVMIEDLVKLSEDLGFKKGMKRGRLREARVIVRQVLRLRKLTPSAEQERAIDTCKDLETLRRWHGQAVLAESAADALR